MKILEEKDGRTLVNCAFCKGKGVDPFETTFYSSKCLACKGEKAIWVNNPIKKCHSCKGTGVSNGTSRNYCIVCHGLGVVSIPENVVECAKCKGSGLHSSGCYCMTCKGVGMHSCN